MTLRAPLRRALQSARNVLVNSPDKNKPCALNLKGLTIIVYDESSHFILVFSFFCLLCCCVFSLASMARLLESQENQGRLIREYERTRDIAANQAMNE